MHSEKHASHCDLCSIYTLLSTEEAAAVRNVYAKAGRPLSLVTNLRGGDEMDEARVSQCH